jgi:hypothetical protein
MLTTRNICFVAFAVYVILFLTWASFGYPTEITVCEAANGTDKCEPHYVPVGVVRWILFQLDRYSVLLTAVFTAFIAWFTWTLKRSTDNAWVVANRSADISERALTDLEAPFIYVKIKSEGLLHQSGRLGGKIRFLFGNYGRTPAHIIEFIDQHEVVGIGQGQPKVIDPVKQRGTVMPYGVVAGPDGVSQDFEHLFAELLSREKVLFFFGYVRYADIFQRTYTLGFCYQFDPKGFRWVLSGGEGYNYCRQDSGPERPPAWFSPSARSGNLSQLFIQLGMQQADRDRGNPT